jgi:deoxyhypusine synthase
MINIHKVKTYSVKKRYSKVALGDFARPPVRKSSFTAFYDALPKILKAKDIHAVVEAVLTARRRRKAVIFMAGAHVIKCGLNPVLIELLKKKVITCIALNGAGVIHDFELAFQGKTSEDVGENLKDGKFGMGRETADFINNAVNDGVLEGLGFGEAVAKKISQEKLPFRKISLLYHAYACKVPICVHVAIGTDIIHQHASFDGSRSGEGSARDFYRLTDTIRGLHNGGVVLNFGSAVILPEVFLKALNLARNLGFKVQNFTTANFDMIHHYRPCQNVVTRSVAGSGKGFCIVGHHEIMLPLVAQAIIERL